jgi:hypothetical protein
MWCPFGQAPPPLTVSDIVYIARATTTRATAQGCAPFFTNAPGCGPRGSNRHSELLRPLGCIAHVARFGSSGVTNCGQRTHRGEGRRCDNAIVQN